MARFLVAQQKYLELLELGQTRKALFVLRRELAPLASPTHPIDSELFSLMICGSVEEIRERAMWSGVGQGSRIRLLEDLQALIPPEKLLPHRRLSHLLEQSKNLQRLQCLYHVTNPPISLLSNHTCSRFSFPIQTSHVLSQHSDEVWRIEWSHDGTRLASAGRDTRCIIWKLTPIKDDAKHPRPVPQNKAPDKFLTITVHLVLDGHPAGISCIAWSPDDSVLLTGSDCTIKMWNTRTGDCISTMVKHEYDVSALSWLPDGQGFVSGGMDSDVLFWDLKGQTTFMWRVSPSRILDLAVSPDGKRLVAIGIAQVNVGNTQTESSHMIPQTRELTCVSISDDSKYALINQSPNEVHLYSLDAHCLIRRYVGQKQGEFIIRSCFGGLNRNFILSGSEDSKIYVWHKETGSLIEVLNGHGEGSVNAVAWNPKHPTMFASAGDDHTVRIWQAPGDERESSPVNVN
ncbi:WD40-repeat-containing domain protein [Melampsora americana]|nr:WD40-repeat-containing domain protein [Melampsora americana]